MQGVRTALQYTAMPRLDAPLVELTTGNITRPWQRLLISLFNKTGGSTSQLTTVVYLQADSHGIGVYNALTGQFLGYLVLENNDGGPAQVLVPGASPFVYTPGASGLLTVAGGELELSRAGSPFGLVGLQGGGLRLLGKDSARVTWFGPDAPTPIIWYPDVA